MDAKQEWAARIAIFSLFVLFFQCDFSFAQDAIKLNWSFEDKRHNVVINFLSVQPVENELKFDITAQNMGEKHYVCLLITGGDEIVHIDDEMGEYPGIKVKFFRGANNKFAPKQRKRISLYIPMPSHEAETANIHFGFNSYVARSTGSCKKPLVDNYKLNFHMTDWDISFIRK